MRKAEVVTKLAERLRGLGVEDAEGVAREVLEFLIGLVVGGGAVVGGSSGGGVPPGVEVEDGEGVGAGVVVAGEVEASSGKELLERLGEALPRRVTVVGASNERIVVDVGLVPVAPLDPSGDVRVVLVRFEPRQAVYVRNEMPDTVDGGLREVTIDIPAGVHFDYVVEVGKRVDLVEVMEWGRKKVYEFSVPKPQVVVAAPQPKEDLYLQYERRMKSFPVVSSPARRPT